MIEFIKRQWRWLRGLAEFQDHMASARPFESPKPRKKAACGTCLHYMKGGPSYSSLLDKCKARVLASDNYNRVTGEDLPDTYRLCDRYNDKGQCKLWEVNDESR